MNLSKQEEVVARLIHKAWNDPKFKSDFISNPVSAIEKETGQKVELPTGVSIVVEDQSEPNTVYLNIPAAADSVELTDDQLEAVAGGSSSCTKPGQLGVYCDPNTGGGKDPLYPKKDWKEIILIPKKF